MRRRPAPALAACAVALGIAACSSTGDADTEVLTSPLDQALGFDPILGLEHRDVFYGTMADCLEEAGFEIPGIREFHTRFKLDVDEPQHLDPVYRAVNGGESRYEQVTSPIDAYADTLPSSTAQAFQLALNGDGNEPGCTQQAQIATYGTTDSAQVEVVITEISGRIAADERRIAVDAKWSSCMSELGYDFAQPDDVATHLQELASQMLERGNSGVNLASDSAAQDAVQLEIDLEKAYNDCAREVDRPAIMQEVIVDVQQDYLEQNPGLREQVRGTS